MSIIGTRPPLISETNFYELHHRARLAIKPGITGMWQVSGRSDITDFEEVVRLDKEYITDWNIGLDIKILFKTVIGDARNLQRFFAPSMSSRNGTTNWVVMIVLWQMQSLTALLMTVIVSTLQGSYQYWQTRYETPVHNSGG